MLSLAVVCVSLMLSPTGQAQLVTDDTSLRGNRWGFNRTEVCLMHKINRVRARHGLPKLRRDKQLGYVARRHAQSMAGSGSLYHDPELGREITRWKRLGQNTGRGGGCKRVFWAFMHSGAHKANILGSWRFMGVGIQRGSGRLYVQQVFESRYDPGNVYHYP